MHAVVAVALESRPVRLLGLVALVALGALSLRIVVVNAFLYVNWADALTYAEGARRVYGGVSPYTAMQLSGPYPLDDASFGFGFVYPPSGAYLLAPFMAGEVFWFAWNAASVVAVVAVVVLIVRREVGHLSIAGTVAVTALAFTLLQPGLTDLETGYLSPMLAAATGAMWLWPKWSGWISILFGLIKVFPAAGLLWAVRKGGSWMAPLVAAIALSLAVAVAHPSFITDWITALANAEPGCPEFAFVSFGCLGSPLVGYIAAAVLLLLAWRAGRDDVAFLLLGLATTVPYPDLYWGNLMVPMVAAIPLLIHESRQWLDQRHMEKPEYVKPVSTVEMNSRS
jgi:hypothetical protein